MSTSFTHLGHNLDTFSHQVSRIETDTKLTDHRNVSSSSQSFHESLGARLGNGTKVVDEISLGHSNTSIDEGQSFGLFVWDDIDFQFLLSFDDGRVSKGLVSDLVQCLKRETRFQVIFILLANLDA